MEYKAGGRTSTPLAQPALAAAYIRFKPSWFALDKSCSPPSYATAAIRRCTSCLILAAMVERVGSMYCTTWSPARGRLRVVDDALPDCKTDIDEFEIRQRSPVMAAGRGIGGR